MIYLDNAATTLIKPSGVIEAISKIYANPGRGGHRLSIAAGEKVLEARCALCELFGCENPTQIIFTQNATEALNIAIKGALSPLDHVVISGMEHNSVVRPLHACGCRISVAMPDEFGCVSAESIEKLIRPDTRMIIVLHASNVCGAVNSIAQIGAMARKRGILFLVDAAQTAGVIPIDVEKDCIDLLAFAGHKALFGPQGTGGLCVRDGIVLKTFKQGGTGSFSEDFHQPETMPDKFESGTLNTGGIAGLLEGVRFISRTGIDAIAEYEQQLCMRLINGLRCIPKIRIYGPSVTSARVGVVAFSFDGIDSITIANTLDSQFNIAARAGLHCASLAHKSLGTLQSGLVRFSVSYFTKQHEVDAAVSAIGEIDRKYLKNF